MITALDKIKVLTIVIDDITEGIMSSDEDKKAYAYSQLEALLVGYVKYTYDSNAKTSYGFVEQVLVGGKV